MKRAGRILVLLIMTVVLIPIESMRKVCSVRSSLKRIR